MPPGFEPAFVKSELWTPLGIRDGRFVLENSTFIQTLARPRPGVTLDETRAELRAMFDAVRTESPATLKGWEVGVRPLREAQFGPQRPAILMLVAAVAIVTLIAAVNLAHLSLAETMSRRGEIAVRLALGARRHDLLRWQLADRVVTAGAGGALGLCLAWLVLPIVTSLDPTGLSSRVAVRIDWTVVVATLLCVGVATVGASLVPAWRATAHDVAPTLAGSSHRSSGTPRHRRLRHLLVGLEMGLAVLLLSTGAMLLDGFRRTAATHPGFDSANVVAAQLRLSEVAYPTEDGRAAFVSAVLERVRRVPGVIDAGTTQNLFVPGFFFVTLVQIEGRPTPTGEPHTVQFRRVSPGYFKAMRIPELAGRTFDGRDVRSGQRVAVVSAQFAQQFWPGDDPIGRTVRRGTGGPVTVIGVVGDVRDVGYGLAAGPTIYIPYAQNNVATAPVGLIVRTDRQRPGLVASVKAAIRDVDPAQPLASVTALDTFLHQSLGPQRFRSALLLVFAGLGLLLASVGVYGVTGRMVLERAREAGVRLALGASTGRVWWTIGSRALGGVVVGAVAGLALAVAAYGGLVRTLPELAGGTPLRSALPAFALLLLTGAVSALFPARRAARVDPLIALRSDELG
jgi:predicted permease